MGPLELLVVLAFIALWIWPSYAIARYAERKGHSFGGFFALGLIVSWVVSWVVALLVADKRDAALSASHPRAGRLEDLQKLGELREAGVLSGPEFEAEKARVLAD